MDEAQKFFWIVKLLPAANIKINDFILNFYILKLLTFNF